MYLVGECQCEMPCEIQADLCLAVSLLTVLLVRLQLLLVDRVVPAVHFCQLGEKHMGSLQLCQGMLIVWQLVGVPSRPVNLERQL